MNKNYYCSRKPGGSGLFIILGYCESRSNVNSNSCRMGLGKSIVGSNYYITHTNFTKNSAVGCGNVSTRISEAYERGGGLSITIDMQSHSNFVHITECNFLENSASWGGAFYALIQEGAHNNVITAKSCLFRKNKVVENAGGGVNAGYHAFNQAPKNNSIHFMYCTFEENSARFGGGVSVYSTSKVNEKENRIVFEHCTWEKNCANFGAALDVSPSHVALNTQYLQMKVQIIDCTFKRNHLNAIEDYYHSYNKGTGVVLIESYRVAIKGHLEFTDNTDSALFLISSVTEFHSNSSANFKNNQAFKGGAIFMVGSSSLVLNDNVQLNFSNNSAIDTGGAIFQHNENKRAIFSLQKRCLFRYAGNKSHMEANNHIVFENNRAGQIGRNTPALGSYGHSIFSVVYKPCKDFDIANFTFMDNRDYEISTIGKEILLDKNLVGKDNVTWAIPGKVFQLPIQTLNDLSKQVAALYHISTMASNSTITVDKDYTYSHNKSAKFYGKPGERTTIILQSLDVKEVVFQMVLRIQECPPGFTYFPTEMKCVCLSRMNVTFDGIPHCREENFEAKLLPGYWMGYCDNSTFGTEVNMMYARCPIWQCQGSGMQYLPQNTNNIKIG